MASITIRNLDDDVKTQLRIRASASGHSVEEEVRLILLKAVKREPSCRARGRRDSAEDVRLNR